MIKGDMTGSSFISHWIRILPGSIHLDGKPVFTSDQHGDEFLNQAYKHFQFRNPRFYKMDALCKCGSLASMLLLPTDSTHNIPPFRKGMVFQNHSSSLETDRKFQHSIQEIASPALFVYTLTNIVMGEIAIQHGFKGENTFFVSRQFDAEQLHQYIAMLFEAGMLEMALIGYLEYLNGTPDILVCRVEKQGELPLTAPQLNSLYHELSVNSNR